MALCSGSGLTGTLGNFLVGAGREREVARDEPLPRAREFDLVLVAMRSTVPATGVRDGLAGARVRLSADTGRRRRHFRNCQLVRHRVAAVP